MSKGNSYLRRPRQFNMVLSAEDQDLLAEVQRVYTIEREMNVSQAQAIRWALKEVARRNKALIAQEAQAE